MILYNANIFTRDGLFEPGCVYVKDGKIEKLEFGDSNANYSSQDIDCQGNYLIPGFIDIHFHGCNGHDFCDATIQALDSIFNYEVKHGITSICPATMTYPEDKLMEVMTCAAKYKQDNKLNIVGINMEGPFISQDKVGAQNPDFVQKPNLEMLNNLQEASGGLIKLIDVAPEVDGAIDFIKKASKNYFVSVAHTNCDYETAIKAYVAGARHLTHTFNAMPPIHHRKPGPIVAASECGSYAEIICDGQHVNYAAVRLAYKLFENKICLISDSCEATGLKDGQYNLGGQEIVKTGNKVTLKESPDTIAAGATNLYDCFKNAVLMADINLETAIVSASTNPAKAIGIDLLYGSIEPGKYADLLIIDKNLDLLNVIKNGQIIER